MPIRRVFEDMEWEDPPRGYYLTDVKQKTLWVNEKTGATWALMKFPAGPGDKLHAHPKANQLGFSISGGVETPDGTRIEFNGGGAGITRKGEVHGRGNFTKETLILMYWDDPPDPELAE